MKIKFPSGVVLLTLLWILQGPLVAFDGVQAEQELGRIAGMAGADERQAALEALVQRNGGIFAADARGSTLLHIAARRNLAGVTPDLLEIFGRERERVRQEEEAAFRQSRGITPSNRELSEEEAAALARILKVKIGAVDGQSRTALHVAGEMRSSDVLKVLLTDEGIDADAKDASGRTALHHAAAKGDLEVLKVLLESSRVMIDLREGHLVLPEPAGHTALHLAAVNGHVEVMREIIGRLSALDGTKPLEGGRLRINEGNNHQETALHCAARNGQDRAVEELLRVPGIDVNAKDRVNRSALQYAAYGGHSAVVERLLELEGIDILCGVEAGQEGGNKMFGQRSGISRTPLELAILADRVEIVRTLLSYMVRTLANMKAETDTAKRNTAGIEAYEEALRRAVALVEHRESDEVRGVLGEFRGTLSGLGKFTGRLVSAILAAGEDTILAAGNDGSRMPQIESRDALGSDSARNVDKRHMQRARELLEEIEDVRYGILEKGGKRYGRTPLHEAARAGFEDIVRNFLARGAEVGIRTGIKKERRWDGTTKGIMCIINKWNGWDALQFAVSFGHRDVIQLLWDAGSALEPERNMLWTAAKDSEPVVAQWLLSCGYDVKAGDEGGRTALHLAVKGDGEEELCAIITRLLVSCGADVNARDELGQTPLHVAVLMGEEDVKPSLAPLMGEKGVKPSLAARVLLAYGGDVDAQDKRGRTPLHLAVDGCPEIIPELLMRMTDINVRDNAGRTALHYAAQKGQPCSVRALIRADGIGLRLTDIHGNGILHYLAGRKGYSDVIQEILDKEPDVDERKRWIDAQDDQGGTALYWAVVSDQIENVRVLLANGADILVKNKPDDERRRWLEDVANESDVKRRMRIDDIERWGRQAAANLPDGIDGNCWKEGINALEAVVRELDGMPEVEKAEVRAMAALLLEYMTPLSPEREAAIGQVRALSEYLKHNQDEAIQLQSLPCENLVRLFDDFQRCRSMLGVYALRGQAAEVERFLQEAKTITPEDVLAAREFARERNRAGTHEAVMQLLDDFQRYGSMLGVYAAKGQTEKVERLLQKAKNITLENVSAAREFARIGGHDAVVQLLDDFQRYGSMLGVYAAKGQMEEVERVLRENKTDVLAALRSLREQKRGLSVEALAAMRAIEDFLRERKIDLHTGQSVTQIEWNLGKVAWIEGAEERQAALEALVQRNGGIFAADARGSTLLHIAARRNLAGVTPDLLEIFGRERERVRQEEEAAFRQSRGITPPDRGLSEEEAAALARILKVKIGAVDGQSRTALHVAGEMRSSDVLRILLTDEGIDADAKDASGRAVLHHAAARGDLEVLKVLLESGRVTIDLREGHNENPQPAGHTALHLAAANGHVDVMGEIMERLSALDRTKPLGGGRIRINEGNNYRETALHCAARNGQDGAVEALLRVPGIDVNVKDLVNRSALQYAAYGGHSAIVERLLRVRYVDILDASKNPLGENPPEGEVPLRTPLELAILADRVDVVRILLSCMTTTMGALTTFVAGAESRSECIKGEQAFQLAGSLEEALQLAGNLEGALQRAGNLKEALWQTGAPEGMLQQARDLERGLQQVKAPKEVLQRAEALRKALELPKALQQIELFKQALQRAVALVENRESNKVREVFEGFREALSGLGKFEGSLEPVILLGKTDKERLAWMMGEEADDTVMRVGDLKKGGSISLVGAREWARARQGARARLEEIQDLGFGIQEIEGEDLRSDIQEIVRERVGRTALHEAARVGFDDIVRNFLARGAEVNIRTCLGRGGKGRRGWTPLHYAANGGNVSTVVLLLDAKAALEIKDGAGRTALSWAVSEDKPAVAQLLLSHGAKTDAVDGYSRTLLRLALGSESREDEGEEAGNRDIVVRLLMSRGAKVKAQDGTGRTPLHVATENGLSLVARILLAYGAGIEAQDSLKRTPLHLAAERCPEIVPELLTRMKDMAAINVQDSSGCTALHYAAQKGSPYAIRALLRVDGIDLRLTDIQGNGVLHYLAGREGCSDVLREILDKEPDVGEQERWIEARNICGQTALHGAVTSCQVENVRVFLDYGADIDVKDRMGRTALGNIAMRVEKIEVRAVGGPVVGPETPETAAQRAQRIHAEEEAQRIGAANEEIEENKRRSYAIAALLLRCMTPLKPECVIAVAETRDLAASHARADLFQLFDDFLRSSLSVCAAEGQTESVERVLCKARVIKIAEGTEDIEITEEAKVKITEEAFLAARELAKAGGHDVAVQLFDDFLYCGSMLGVYAHRGQAEEVERILRENKSITTEDILAARKLVDTKKYAEVAQLLDDWCRRRLEDCAARGQQEEVERLLRGAWKGWSITKAEVFRARDLAGSESHEGIAQILREVIRFLGSPQTRDMRSMMLTMLRVYAIRGQVKEVKEVLQELGGVTTREILAVRELARSNRRTEVVQYIGDLLRSSLMQHVEKGEVKEVELFLYGFQGTAIARDVVTRDMIQNARELAKAGTHGVAVQLFDDFLYCGSMLGVYAHRGQVEEVERILRENKSITTEDILAAREFAREGNGEGTHGVVVQLLDNFLRSKGIDPDTGKPIVPGNAADVLVEAPMPLMDFDGDQAAQELRRIAGMAEAGEQQAALDELIQRNGGEQAEDAQGRTLLHITIQGRLVEVAKLLLARGIDVNVRDYCGRTPLHIAAIFCPEIIPEVLTREGNINVQDDLGFTPLCCAAQRGNSLSVRALLEVGEVEVHLMNIHGRGILHYLAGCENCSDVLQEILNEELDVGKRKKWIDAQDDQGRTALHEAVLESNVENVRVLLANGAGTNVEDRNGEIALLMAAREIAEAVGNPEGRVPDDEIRIGNEALRKAREGSLTIAALLLEHVNLLSSNDKAIVIKVRARAGDNKRKDVVRLLDDFIRLRTMLGVYAIRGQVKEVERLLCEDGNQTEVTDVQKLRELKKHKDVVRLLNDFQRYGSMLKVYAAKGQREEVERFLRENWDVKHQTIVHAQMLADDNNHNDIVRLLKDFVCLQTMLGVYVYRGEVHGIKEFLRGGKHITRETIERMLRIFGERMLPYADRKKILSGAVRAAMDTINTFVRKKGIKGIDPDTGDLIVAEEVTGPSVEDIMPLMAFDGVQAEQELGRIAGTAEAGERQAALEALVQANGGIFAMDAQGSTLLHIAARRNLAGVTPDLLEIFGRERERVRQEEEAAFRQSRGITPPDRRLSEEEAAALARILEVKIGAVDGQSRTALHVAGETENYDVLKVLLADGGIDADAKDASGRTVLHHAAARGDLEVLKVLLDSDRVTIDLREGHDEDPPPAGHTALHLAAANGHVEVMRETIGRLSALDGTKPLEGGRLRINEGNNHQETALHCAARNGQDGPVEELLRVPGIDVNAKDRVNRSALQYAAYGGHSAIVRCLLRVGYVDILDASKNPLGENPPEGEVPLRTPLELAILADRVKVARILLAHMTRRLADMEAETDTAKRNTAGIEAYEEALRRAVALVEHRGSDKVRGVLGEFREALSGLGKFEGNLGPVISNYSGERGRPEVQVPGVLWEKTDEERLAWMISKEGYKNDTMIRLGDSTLQEVRARLEEIQDLGFGIQEIRGERYGRTSLHDAARAGFEDIVRNFLARGAKVNIRAAKQQGWTPLHYAANLGRVSTVRLLLDSKKAALEIEDGSKRTALCWAVSGDKPAVVQLLLDRGANVKAKDEWRRTALHLAVGAGDGKYRERNRGVIVRLLVSRGAEINARDRTGRTPLHVATEKGLSLVARILLAYGADVEAQDAFKQTPLHLAVKHYLEIVPELLMRMTDINVQDNSGCTALHYTAQRCEPYVIRALLKVDGIDVRLTDNQNLSVLHYLAGREGYRDVLWEILDKEPDVDERKRWIDAQDNQGGTALHRAVANYQVENVEVLLGYGAAIDVKDGKGKTALEILMGELRDVSGEDAEEERVKVRTIAALLLEGMPLNPKHEAAVAEMRDMAKSRARKDLVQLSDDFLRRSLGVYAAEGQTESVERILCKAKDIKITEEAVLAARGSAGSKEHAKVVQLFDDFQRCRSMLGLYAERGQVEDVERLLKGDENVTMEELLVARELARSNKHDDIVYCCNDFLHRHLGTYASEGRIKDVERVLWEAENINIRNIPNARELARTKDHGEVVQLLDDFQKHGTMLKVYALRGQTAEIERFLREVRGVARGEILAARNLARSNGRTEVVDFFNNYLRGILVENYVSKVNTEEVEKFLCEVEGLWEGTLEEALNVAKSKGNVELTQLLEGFEDCGSILGAYAIRGQVENVERFLCEAGTVAEETVRKAQNLARSRRHDVIVKLFDDFLRCGSMLGIYATQGEKEKAERFLRKAKNVPNEVVLGARKLAEANRHAEIVKLLDGFGHYRAMLGFYIAYGKVGDVQRVLEEDKNVTVEAVLDVRRIAKACGEFKDIIRHCDAWCNRMLKVFAVQRRWREAWELLNRTWDRGVEDMWRARKLAIINGCDWLAQACDNWCRDRLATYVRAGQVEELEKLSQGAWGITSADIFMERQRAISNKQVVQVLDNWCRKMLVDCADWGQAQEVERLLRGAWNITPEAVLEARGWAEIKDKGRLTEHQIKRRLEVVRVMDEWLRTHLNICTAQGKVDEVQSLLQGWLGITPADVLAARKSAKTEEHPKVIRTLDEWLLNRLKVCVREGKVKEVESLLRRAWNIIQKDIWSLSVEARTQKQDHILRLFGSISRCGTMLGVYADQGNLQEVKSLLREDGDMRVEAVLAARKLAVTKEHLEVIQVLDEWCRRRLVDCAAQGQTDELKSLLQGVWNMRTEDILRARRAAEDNRQTWNVRLLDSWCRRRLVYCAAKGQTQEVKGFLRGIWGITSTDVLAARKSAETKDRLDVVRILDKWGRRSLKDYAAKGRVAEVGSLLRGIWGVTSADVLVARKWAQTKRHLRVVQVLDEWCRRRLVYCADQGKVDEVKSLLREDRDMTVDAVLAARESAETKGHLEVVQILDEWCRRRLVNCADQGKVDEVKSLLRGIWGVTSADVLVARGWAQTKGRLGVVQILDEWCRRRLVYCADQGKVDEVKSLLRGIWGVTSADVLEARGAVRGWTQRHLEVVQILDEWCRRRLVNCADQGKVDEVKSLLRGTWNITVADVLEARKWAQTKRCLGVVQIKRRLRVVQILDEWCRRRLVNCADQGKVDEVKSLLRGIWGVTSADVLEARGAVRGWTQRHLEVVQILDEWCRRRLVYCVDQGNLQEVESLLRGIWGVTSADVLEARKLAETKDHLEVVQILDEWCRRRLVSCTAKGQVAEIESLLRGTWNITVADVWAAREFARAGGPGAAVQLLDDFLRSQGPDTEQPVAPGEARAVPAKAPVLPAVWELFAMIDRDDAGKLSEALEGYALHRPEVDLNTVRKDIPKMGLLHWATWKGALRCLRMLAKRPEINPNILSKGGRTPLYEAVWKPEAELARECVQVLLEIPEIDVNLAGGFGVEDCPLGIAVGCCRTDIVSMLLATARIEEHDVRRVWKYYGYSNKYNEKRKKSLEILGKFLVDHQPSPCWEKKDGVYLPRDQELPAHYPRLGEEEKPLAFASCEMVTGTQFVEDPCTPEADRNTRIWALLPRKVQNCLRHWGVVKQVEGKEEIIVQSPLFGTCVVHRPKAVFGARTEKVLRWKWEGEGSVGAEVYLFSVSQGRIRFEGGKNETARGDAPRVSSLASGLSWQGAGRPWNGEICLELAISGREGEALIFYLLIKGTDKTRVSLEILLPQYSENLNMGGIARLLSPEAGRGEDGSGLRR